MRADNGQETAAQREPQAEAPPAEAPRAAAPRAEVAVTLRTHHTETGVAVCTIVGDLDFDTLASVEEELTGLVEERTPPRPSALVVDLAQVGFCDSSGLNLLLRTRAAAVAAGMDLRLAAVAPAVRRVLELTGADTVFSLYDSVTDAIAA
ncbi:STAS domain-containing protein [Streptomyces sp. NPDC012769]|uniref:STAS domain-containing protein n=1 Tax=Streptomyces sp. NPDC012769 TaxID=3364848 RepID=UPI0036977390